MRIRIEGLKEIKEMLNGTNGKEDNTVEVLPCDNEVREACFEDTRKIARLMFVELVEEARRYHRDIDELRYILDLMCRSKEAGERESVFTALEAIAFYAELDAMDLVTQCVGICKYRKEFFVDYFCEYLIDEFLLENDGGEEDETDECDCNM